MEPHYDDSFSRRYQNIPAAYYLHHYNGTVHPWLDRNGDYIYTNLHNHAEIELLLFETGNGINRIGASRTRVPFEAGDLFIFNPFELHGGSYAKGTHEQQHLAIDFPVSLLEHPHAAEASRLSGLLLSQTVHITNRITPSDHAYADLRAAYLGMYEAISGEAPDDMLFFGSLFRFFGVLSRAGHIHAAADTTTQTGDMNFIKDVLSYIGEHYAEPISTRDIATKMRYSKEHFCRLFRTHFSVTFLEYLTQYRIEKAKRYLMDHSSLEVAEKCGFSSQSNFSRAFRESVGISPSEYKKFIASPAEQCTNRDGSGE